MTDYVPVRVSTIRSDEPLPFPIYVIVNDKPILYVREGGLLERERLTRLKDKRFKRFYIQLAHEELYRLYVKRNLELAGNPSLGTELRAGLIAGQQIAQIEALLEQPNVAEIYDESRKAAIMLSHFLKTHPDLAIEFMKLENLREDVAHHSFIVAVLSTLLAHRLNETRTPALILGAFLHDIEHMFSPIHLFHPVAEMTPDDQALHAMHALAGHDRLTKALFIEADVLEIVRDHENDPNSIPSPLASMVSSANQIDRLITFEGVEKKKAVGAIIERFPERYVPEHLQILGEIFDKHF